MKWQWLRVDTNTTDLINDDAEVVLSIYESHGGGSMPSEAHQVLIAAAPRLLAAAKTIASFAQSWQPLTPGDIKELTDAIREAEPR